MSLAHLEVWQRILDGRNVGKELGDGEESYKDRCFGKPCSQFGDAEGKTPGSGNGVRPDHADDDAEKSGYESLEQRTLRGIGNHDQRAHDDGENLEGAELDGLLRYEGRDRKENKITESAAKEGCHDAVAERLAGFAARCHGVTIICSGY